MAQVILYWTVSNAKNSHGTLIDWAFKKNKKQKQKQKQNQERKKNQLSRLFYLVCESGSRNPYCVVSNAKSSYEAAVDRAFKESN